MSRHRLRHERAYAAGGRDACEKIEAVLAPLLREKEQRAALNRLIDNIRQSSFRMPAPNAARGESQ